MPPNSNKVIFLTWLFGYHLQIKKKKCWDLLEFEIFVLFPWKMEHTSRAGTLQLHVYSQHRKQNKIQMLDLS